jgi:hypothetical protein
MASNNEVESQLAAMRAELGAGPATQAIGAVQPAAEEPPAAPPAGNPPQGSQG